MSTTNKVCSSLGIQQEQQSAPSSRDSNSSAGATVRFWDFIQTLNDVEPCKNPILKEEGRKNRCEFNTGKALYQEGVTNF